MKNYILIALVALLGFSSCKKTVINNYSDKLESSTTPLVQLNDENYNHTGVYIESNDWKIIARYDNPVTTGESGLWKLQNSNGTKNFIIIDPAPSHFYWKAEYNIGKILSGNQVIKMNIKYFPNKTSIK